MNTVTVYGNQVTVLPTGLLYTVDFNAEQCYYTLLSWLYVTSYSTATCFMFMFVGCTYDVCHNYFFYRMILDSCVVDLSTV